MPPAHIYPQKRLNLTTVAVGCALVCYIAVMLVSSYSSQMKLREATLEQLKQDAEKRASAVSYFYSERKNDVGELANNRTVTAYFENQALGMSMQYGLTASLIGIADTFEQVLTEKKLDSDRIYQRIVLTDPEGKVLVDRRSPLAPATSLDWKQFLSPDNPAPVMLIRPGEERVDVLISVPCYFKGRFSGQITAWVHSETVCEHLVSTTKGPASKRIACIVAERGGEFLPLNDPKDAYCSRIKDLSKLKAGEIHAFRQTAVDNYEVGERNAEFLGITTPIKGAPFFLVTFVPKAEVLGETPPWMLPMGMGLLSLFILGGLVIVWSIRMRNIVLHTRLEEAARGKQEVESRNEALSKEIVERRRIEEALRESEERYRQLADLLPQPIFEMDANNRLTFVNRAAFKAFGYTPEDFLKGLDARLLFSPEDQIRVIHGLCPSVREGARETSAIEFSARRKDGTRFPALIYASSIMQGDLVVGLRGTIMDLSERKKMETELLRTQKLESVGVLAGGIAHDFNNILTAIIGYTELAMRKTENDVPVHGYIQEILQASLRARDLVQQILAFSRKGETELVPLEIDSVVKEAMKLIRASLPTTIEIRQEIRRQHAVVRADPTQIHQVIMNLCTNAAHAMSGRTGLLEVIVDRVILNAEEAAGAENLGQGAYVSLTVRDNGMGMDPELQDRIFEPYFTTKAKGVGTGLGLSVVHGIIRALGGAISVESEVGKGSTFQVLLPLANAEVKARSTASIQAFRGSEHILLVDDEQTIVEIGREALKHLGYHVAANNSSVEALQLFKDRPDDFDLVITDMTMPNMTGEELARELMRIRPNIPIILCTGYNDMMTEKKAKEMGIREYLAKPWVIQDLSSAIRRALDQH